MATPKPVGNVNLAQPRCFPHLNQPVCPHLGKHAASVLSNACLINQAGSARFRAYIFPQSVFGHLTPRSFVISLVR
jgi:hypothetical protein